MIVLEEKNDGFSPSKTISNKQYSLARFRCFAMVLQGKPLGYDQRNTVFKLSNKESFSQTQSLYVQSGPFVYHLYVEVCTFSSVCI